MEISEEQGTMGVAEIIETRMALHCLDESSLSGFVNNNVENLLATLQEAMEFEDVECRILVSNMVGEAIMRGLVRAVSEEASEQLCAKDLEIARERNITRDKEVAIAELEMALHAKEAELAAHIEDADAHARNRALAFAHELEQTFQRWQCSESTALEKEAESAKIAGHLIEMASLLKNETENGAALESRLQQLLESDSSKAAQIASLQEREEQLRTEARFNELMLNEIIKSFREEVQQVLEEKEKENEELKILLKERDKLKETESSVTDLKEQVVEQKFMQEVESEIIKVCFEGAMPNTFKEVDVLGKSSIKQGKSENSHIPRKSKYTLDGSVQDFKQKFQSLEDGDMIAAGVKKDCTQLKHCTDCKAQLEDQKFRFEIEIDLISSYWLSVTNFMQQELQDLHRDLNSSQAKLSIAEAELSESKQHALNFKTESQSINQAYEHTVTQIDLLEGKLEVLETESKEMFNLKDGEITLLTRYREELIWRHEVESQLVAENLDCWRTELAKVLAMKDEEILCLRIEIDKLKQKQGSYLVSQQSSIDSELLVTSTILHQKQQEVAEKVLTSNSFANRKDCELELIQGMAVEKAEEMKACKKNLEMLAHELKKLDMQLSSVNPHMVQTKCTSPSCCDCDISDIQFDAALQRLQSQVKTIESRVTWMMEQSEHQEWRHNVEVEIGLFICTDAFEESKRKLEENQKVGTSRVIFHDEIKKSLDMVEPPVGNTAQLISSLKSEIADLKREKEQIVCDKTEEIYKLKRAFWKEKEKWISGSCLSNDRDMSNPTKWPAKSTILSGDYIERVGSIDSDIIASAFREEWQIEKAGDLEKIAQLENEVKVLQEKLACMEELEKEKVGLLQRTSELENNVNELTQRLAEYNVASEWESEKPRFLEKIIQLENNAEVLEKNLASAEELGREKVGLLQRTSELENNVKELTQKLAELNKKGSDIVASAFREEWEIEKANYLEKTTQLEKDAEVLEKKLAFVEELEREKADLLQRTSQSEGTVKELTHKLVEFSLKEDEHATRESQLLAHINQLENERNRLLAEQKNSDSVREMLEREKSDGVLEKKLASVEELEREKAVFLQRTSELESNVKELTKTLVELSQKEENFISRESQLLDRINQIENERNSLLEEWKSSDSVRDILEREVFDKVLEEKLASVEELEREKVGLLQRTSELESNVEELMHKFVELNRKEDDHATRESQLLAHINQLENERNWLLAEKKNSDSVRGILEREKYDLMRQRPCTEKELKEVGEKYTALVESGKANAMTEFKPSTYVGELENPPTYTSEMNMLHDYTSSLELEKQHLLLLISEKDKEIQSMKENITELVEKEKRHLMTESGLLNRIKDLEKEMQQLVEEQSSSKSLLTSLLAQKDRALALAVKDKEEEGRLRSTLEKQLQQSKLETDTLSSQISKVMELRSGLNSIQEQLRTCLTGELNGSLHAFDRFENDTKALIQDKIVRLEHLQAQYGSLKEQFKTFASREYLYSKKLLREVNNLQKAEAEVDLLGDEVDALLDLLGKAVETLDIYYPMLKNYPQIAELRKLLKHELHLRTEPLLGC